MKRQNEYTIAVSRIKGHLKKMGWTYGDLARELKRSESGIKKILNGKDGSFQRLVEICQVTGLSLIEIVEDRSQIPVEFNEKEQKFFLENQTAFLLYWLLVYERAEPSSAFEKLKLSSVQGMKELRKLDQNNFIKLMPGDRIKVPAIRGIKWVGDGPFLRKLYLDWGQSFVREIAKPQVAEGEFLTFRYLQMTASLFGEFLNALSKIEQEFVQRSIQEMQTNAPGRTHVRWLVGVDKKSFVTGSSIL